MSVLYRISAVNYTVALGGHALVDAVHTFVEIDEARSECLFVAGKLYHQLRNCDPEIVAQKYVLVVIFTFIKYERRANCPKTCVLVPLQLKI